MGCLRFFTLGIFSILLFSTAASLATSRAPLVFVVSGGFGTCSDSIPDKMRARLSGIADRARSEGRYVKFIMTCFSRLRPSEDMEYYSIDDEKGRSPRQVIRGGRFFETNFRTRFLRGYLNREIPRGAEVVTVGQSHGGWVSLNIAAIRPVDFLVTLDPISRTECSFRNILDLHVIRNLKSGICNRPVSAELLAAVERNLALNGGVALNLFQTASILHSGPIGSPWIQDINFGKFYSQYRGWEGNRELNAEAHRALACDARAWRGILAQMDRQLEARDLDWNLPQRDSIALSNPHRKPLELASHTD